jgi:hypothetical protein
MLIYKWMEEIQIVRGSNRLCLYDLPRKEYHFAPIDFEKLIIKIEGKSDTTSFQLSNDEMEWVSFMEEEEFIIKIPKSVLNEFIPISLKWEHPSIITNAIIYDNENIDKCLTLADQLCCKQLVITCKSVERLKVLMESNFRISNFQNIDVILEEVEHENVLRLKEEFPIIGGVFTKQKYSKNELGAIMTLRDSDNNKKAFLVNIELFSESQVHHTYFNRKLFIGANGEIKNSPETEEIFGYIQNINSADELKEIILTPQFQKYWTVHKDICDVCKYCEFRHMCVENKIPYERKENQWYHKIECNYNPFIAKWEGEQGYLTLSECGIISNETEFSYDHDRLKQINDELWGEESK